MISMQELASIALVINLIQLRILGFLVVCPILLDYKVPPKVLLAISLTMSFLLASNPTFMEMYVEHEVTQIQLDLILLNMFIGFMFGLVMCLAIEFVKIGAKIIAFSMGMGFSQMVDPVNGKQTDGVSSAIYVGFLLLFVSEDGLLMFYDSMLLSFLSYPVTNPMMHPAKILNLVQSVSLTFLYGVMMATPFMACGLLINCGLAVISKSAPSMNLFTIGFPLCILLGLTGLKISDVSLFTDLMLYMNQLKSTHLEIIK